MEDSTDTGVVVEEALRVPQESQEDDEFAVVVAFVPSGAVEEVAKVDVVVLVTTVVPINASDPSAAGLLPPHMRTISASRQCNPHQGRFNQLLSMYRRR
mmetsp:Transcript_31050/g.64782  ORF Transcript_31050/g.64782 Transcript_31050/m.64782 type:complete len:99 (-) Transcript_31050:38-334(-)